MMKKTARTSKAPSLSLGVFVGLVTLLALAAGLRGLIWLYSDSLLGYQSLSWPHTRGQIIFSYVETSAGPRGSTEYAVAAIYTYEVDGIAFQGEQIAFPETRSSSRSEIESQLKAYPPGAVVNVYYDPHKPEVACLQPGFSIWFVVCMGPMSLLFLAGGFWGLRYFYQRTQGRM